MNVRGRAGRERASTVALWVLIDVTRRVSYSAELLTIEYAILGAMFIFKVHLERAYFEHD